MTETVKFGSRVALWRATLLTLLLLPLFSCNTTEPLTETDTSADGAVTPAKEAPSLAVAYAGGIPFGLYTLPTNQFGSIYNGAHRSARILDSTGTFISTLAAIKARGGKVVLNLAGKHFSYLDSSRHFSFSKWKARVDTFKKYKTAMTPYITDGTIIAHFLIDEPNDASNFGGLAVTGTQVEAMAAYSKSIWPTLPTITRTESTYLAKWPGYKYLNATWAQYVYRKGDAGDFIRRNVADARNLSLALVTGLNIMRGGPNGAKMTPTQIKTWGSTLLSSSYPCAFISYEYSSYFTLTSVKDAMKYLRAKAQNEHAFKSCS
jgi:hypothetical protein